MLIFNNNLKVFTEKSILLNRHQQFLNHYFIFENFLSAILKNNNSKFLSGNYAGNECVLSAIGTMSKRVRSKSLLKPKKLKRNLSPNNKRSSIPRSCKHSAKSNFVDYNFDFLSMPTNKIVLNSNQMKMDNVSKDKKKEEKHSNQSTDEELDVVFDIQEEKKNKIYEVITVMSDDETPNQISYERIYADKPEDKIVDPDTVQKTFGHKSNNLSVGTVQNLDNGNVQHSAIKKESVITKIESSSKNDHSNNDESEDDVVCLAVIDAKAKAEMKKANIEEICLSSDSESDITPTVRPMRLKIPAIPNYANWSVDHLLGSVGNDRSFDLNSPSTNFSFGFKNRFLYPYVIEQKKTNVLHTLSDWGSSSSSPKRASSEELSSLTNTPDLLSADDSSLSVTSDSNNHPNNDNVSSIDNENISSSSSSSDEENRIYWKANRQSRRKEELMYEEFTSYGKKVNQGEITVDSNKSLTFKVMSYNVLAQNLLEEHRYLYKHHDRRALGWARRWALIYNDIKEENPEILCLQEVENIYLTSHYAKLHDLGYRWIYKKRTSVYEDGLAIFYKADTFTEDEHSKVEYFQPGVSVLDRDNVGLVVRLRIRKSPSHAIVVSTTHLLYNPRRSDVKLAQIQMLLAEIDRLAFDRDNSTYYPVILTGDFNLKPRNGVYKLLTEGQIRYEGMSRKNLNPTDDSNVLPKILLPCRLGINDMCQHVEVLEARTQGKTPSTSTNIYHSEYNKSPNKDCLREDGFQSGSLRQTFNFRSVYPHVKEDGQKEASTHHDHWITVDYIFYSCQEENNKSSLHLLSRVRLPTQDECERLLRFLPNFAFGSDHLPLVGKFLLKLY